MKKELKTKIVLLSIFSITNLWFINLGKSKARKPASVVTTSTGEMSLLEDIQYKNGFDILSPTPGSAVKTGLLQAGSQVGKVPAYNLAQWYSKSDIVSSSPIQRPSGAYIWKDLNKEIIYGQPGTSEEGITLSVNSFNEYSNRFRDGSTKDWPHLYISQDMGKRLPSIKELSTVRLTMEAKLIRAIEKMSDGFNPSIHTAQYVVYFLIQNLNQQSPGYGNDFVNFGFSLYDSRYTFPSSFVMPDPDGGHLIWQMGLNQLTSKSLKSKEWVSINKNIFSDIRKSVQYAIDKGVFKSKDLSDYYLSSMVAGWEVPGLSDVSIQVKNFNIYASTWNDPVVFQFNSNNETEGWVNLGAQAEKRLPQDGIWKLLAKASRMSCIENTSLNINAAKFKKIKLKILAKKEFGKSDGAYINWRNSSLSKNTSSPRMDLPLIYDNHWHDYVLDMSGQPEWKDGITSLSIFYGFQGTRAHVAFDSIEFVE